MEREPFAVEAEGFEGGVESDFVSVAEDIDNAAFWAVDAKGMAVDGDFLDALGEDVGDGPVDVNGGILYARGLAAARQGNIHGMGDLGGDAVVGKGGDHANDGGGAAFADGEDVGLTWLGLVGKAIESATEGLDVTEIAHAVEDLGVYSLSKRVAGAEDAAVTQKDGTGVLESVGGYGGHDDSYTSIFILLQVYLSLSVDFLAGL